VKEGTLQLARATPDRAEPDAILEAGAISRVRETVLVS
jgi:hypothetical protein